MRLAQIGGDAAGRLVFKLQDSHIPSHAWEVSLRYNNHWIASVYPGFVNGVDPITKFNKTKVGLCRFPDIPVTKFIDPFGSPPYIPAWKIPPFFLSMGCIYPQTGVNVDTTAGTVSTTDTQAPKDARDILRSQIWVSQARPTYKVEVNTPGNLVQGDLVNYQVTYNNASVNALGERPELMCAEGMPAPVQASLESRLAGAYGDNGVDTVLIASIYFVSLPQNDSNYSAEINDTWVPYVVHECFWNLGYAPKNTTPANIQSNPLDPSLAFFLGQYVVPAAFQGSQDALLSQILEAVNNSANLTGTFYTA